MDPQWAVPVGSVIVAVISALAAFLSQRSASQTAKATSRMDHERDAYERARSYDTETIRRQDEEIAEVRAENKLLRDEIRILRTRISRLEAGIPPEDDHKGVFHG